MPREIHLSSLVVHALPAALDEVAAQIADMGCEIHMTSPEGKLIVTHETEDARALGDTLTRMQLLDGVLSATMVYHHCEPAEPEAEAPASQQEEREVPHEDEPT